MYQTSTYPKVASVSLAIALLTLTQTVVAQQEAPVDWPCIQRLVPKVEAAVLWPGVIDDTDPDKWQADETVAPLAQSLGDLDSVSDETRQSISDFAETVPESERASRLSLLAQGILAVANERRSLFIDGIRRYTRQQIDVAKQIEEHRNALNDMDVKAVPAQDSARMELEETVKWQQRIFDQREDAIQSLCDQPVAVEETLGEVLREVAQYLP